MPAIAVWLPCGPGAFRLEDVPLLPGLLRRGLVRPATAATLPPGRAEARRMIGRASPLGRILLIPSRTV